MNFSGGELTPSPISIDSSSSPLDFSRKNKSPIPVDDSQSGISRLRNILKMKSPSSVSEHEFKVLNLSKTNTISPNSSIEMDTTPPTGKPTYSSLGIQLSQYPIFRNHHNFVGQITDIPFTSPTTPSAFSQIHSNNNSNQYSNNHSSSTSPKSRVTRPFKAYPKDPLTFPSVGLYGFPDGIIQDSSNSAYAEFRKQMLNQTQNGKVRRGSTHKNTQIISDSTTSSTNPNNFGLIHSPVDDNDSASEDSYSNSHFKNKNKSDEQLKDEAYWERRRKNNEAAKRSRDARRAKEDEIAIRAAFLEQENLKLRCEVFALKNETAKLRCMLYKAQ